MDDIATGPTVDDIVDEDELDEFTTGDSDAPLDNANIDRIKPDNFDDDEVGHDDVGIYGYTGETLDEVLDAHEPDTPPETLDAEWIPREHLTPNDWNPNFIPQRRQDMLVMSLLDNGWTAPILVDEDNTIIDGEHRWRLARDDRLAEAAALTPADVPAGHVPVFRVEHDREEAMLATYQQNYARGQEDLSELAEMLDELDDEQLDRARTRMTMEPQEMEMMLPDDDVRTVDPDESDVLTLPWEEETEEESAGDATTSGEAQYDGRITLEMLLEEADLARHIFGGEPSINELLAFVEYCLSESILADVPELTMPDETVIADYDRFAEEYDD